MWHHLCNFFKLLCCYCSAADRLICFCCFCSVVQCWPQGQHVLPCLTKLSCLFIVFLITHTIIMSINCKICIVRCLWDVCYVSVQQHSYEWALWSLFACANSRLLAQGWELSTPTPAAVVPCWFEGHWHYLVILTYWSWCYARVHLESVWYWVYLYPLLELRRWVKPPPSIEMFCFSRVCLWIGSTCLSDPQIYS